MEIELKEFGVRIRLIVEPAAHESNASALMERVPEKSGPPEPRVEHEQDMGHRSPGRQAMERRLRNWRREEAIRRGVPTYIIMTERTIKSIVQQPPQSLDQLREQKGIGPKTMELYGDALLDLIQNEGEEE